VRTAEGRVQGVAGYQIGLSYIYIYIYIHDSLKRDSLEYIVHRWIIPCQRTKLIKLINLN